MELGDRKKRILQSVIESYIETAEPVGSRFIAKKNNLMLSPATVRNEMADLEELGYLEQPHASAGRVPSQLGYRFYVDQLMKKYLLSIAEMERMNEAMKLRREEIDKMIAQACQIMSEMTDFTTVAVTKQDKSRIKKLDLILLDQNSFLAVLVTDNAVVKNRLFRVKQPIHEERLRLLALLLNRTLANESIGSVTFDMIESLKRVAPEYDAMIMPILHFVHEVVAQLEKSNVILNGANNVLKFPEFSDMNKARSFIAFLESSEEIGDMIKQVSDSPEQNFMEQTKIVIGKENPNPNMQGSSIVIRAYQLDNSMVGWLGLIGPVRMDYAKAVSDLEYFGHRLSLLIDEVFYNSDAT
jgi:heat-inducible transcriptional repressor